MPRTTIDWESRIGRRLGVRDLHVFVTVVQWGSMAKAARQLNVTQPAAVGTKAQIALQNPKVRLKPNMFAYTTFFGRKETVPVVPSSALDL